MKIYNLFVCYVDYISVLKNLKLFLLRIKDNASIILDQELRSNVLMLAKC